MIPIGIDVGPAITAFFHYGTGLFLYAQSAITSMRETELFSRRKIRDPGMGEENQ